MSHIAIIGAGASGLAAALRLSQKGHEVTAFEKSRGVSGRAASRSRNGCRYDHGANYFKPTSNEVAELLFQTLPHDDLCPILGDIWTFDQAGSIAPGDPKLNAESKWTYRSGISTLGKLLIEEGNFTVNRETLITNLSHKNDQWTLTDSDGNTHGAFQVLLLTPPAPQTVDLLSRTNANPAIISEIVGVLGQAPYHSQFSVLLNFNAKFTLPDNAYALINSDRQHRLAWLSDESHKEGRVPKGETLLVAQMNPAWSAEHYDDSLPSIISASYESVNELLGGNLPTIHWADTQRWRYAHPYEAANVAETSPAAAIGLFFAGDSFVGKDRVPGALRTGLSAAQRIESSLAE